MSERSFVNRLEMVYNLSFLITEPIVLEISQFTDR